MPARFGFFFMGMIGRAKRAQRVKHAEHNKEVIWYKWRDAEGAHKVALWDNSVFCVKHGKLWKESFPSAKCAICQGDFLTEMEVRNKNG